MTTRTRRPPRKEEDKTLATQDISPKKAESTRRTPDIQERKKGGKENVLKSERIRTRRDRTTIQMQARGPPTKTKLLYFLPRISPVVCRPPLAPSTDDRPLSTHSVRTRKAENGEWRY